jgi:hypothetical protein
MKTSTAAIFLATAFAMALVPSAHAKLIRGNVPSPSNKLAGEERELGGSGGSGGSYKKKTGKAKKGKGGRNRKL